MSKTEYQYYILKNLWIARLPKNSFSLEPKGFYKDGKWEFDDKLNLRLNDCIMDYGDSRWYKYDEVSEEEAMAFIENQKN